MDAIKLHRTIYKKGLSISLVSTLSGIDICRLYDSIFEHRSMTIGDAMALKETLGLTDAEAVDIFLRGDDI